MNRLVIAESYSDADMFYATGVLVPDPFVFAEFGKNKFILVSKLEYGRVKLQCKKGIKVLLQEDMAFECQKLLGSVSLDGLVLTLLKKHKVKKVSVAKHFSVGTADFLRSHKIKAVN